MDRLERELGRIRRGRDVVREGALQTGVDGLDALLGGGFPRGHVIVLHGPTGTLKTSLALATLAHNAGEDGRRLYISLEEGRESLQRTMQGLGLPAEDFIVDLATMRAEHDVGEEVRDWFQILLSYLQRRVGEGLDLLVIDPLDALFALAPFAPPRQELFQFFNFLREAGVTALLITEEPGFVHQEDRLADGVLQTAEREGKNGRVDLLLRCTKLRHGAHSRDHHRLELLDGRLVVSPLGE